MPASPRSRCASAWRSRRGRGAARAVIAERRRARRRSCSRRATAWSCTSPRPPRRWTARSTASLALLAARADVTPELLRAHAHVRTGAEAPRRTSAAWRRGSTRWCSARRRSSGSSSAPLADGARTTGCSAGCSSALGVARRSRPEAAPARGCAPRRRADLGGRGRGARARRREALAGARGRGVRRRRDRGRCAAAARGARRGARGRAQPHARRAPRRSRARHGAASRRGRRGADASRRPT